jgi:amino acid ABC transporter substrate-binding protein, PAAT family (TC 3.A.1.3.-)
MIKNIVHKRFLAAALAIAALFACTGCQTKVTEVPEADVSMKKILDSGRLVLGLDASFPPMGFTDENGEIVGFDIDVAQEVCDRLGIMLVKMPINWDEKEAKLNQGEIDCIWNGMSVTSAREEAMRLSDPYMKNEMIFVVPGGSRIRSMNDLEGKTVGVQAGSTAQELLEASKFSAEITVMTWKDNVTLLDELANGGIDAGFLDSVVAYYYISTNDGKYFILPGNLGEEEYAVGFRKDDQTLRDEVQKIIFEMKADGKLGEIAKRWFGSDITSLR